MDSKDRVLADLLRLGEPPPVDPAFRLAVLERCAAQVFRRRLVVALLAALAPSVVLAIALRKSAGSMEAVSLLIVGAGLVASWRSYAPVLVDWARRVLGTRRN